MTYCGLLEAIGSEAGLLFLAGIISPLFWEWFPKVKDWYDKLTAREKQAIIAGCAFVLILGTTVLKVGTCGLVVADWANEVVRVGVMVAGIFGIATGVHQADVKLIQRR